MFLLHSDCSPVWFGCCCARPGELQIIYTLELTPAQMRRLINLQFKKHMGLTDPRVIDMLVVQGEMELEETVNQWKMKPHVMELLEASAVLNPKPQAADLPDVHRDQQWMRDLVAAAEIAAGVPADIKRADRLAAAATELIRGNMLAPGTDVAPALPSGLQELWEDVQTSGRTRIPDHLLSGESPGDTRNFYNRDKPSRPPPELLMKLREAVDAGELSSQQEQERAVLVAERAARVTVPGDAQSFRVPPTRRAEALLPPWVACRTRLPQASSDLLGEERARALEHHQLAVALPQGAPVPEAGDSATESVSALRRTEAAAEQVYAMFMARREATLGARA